jgi:capsular polysaccharide biosynthesis protein
LRRIRQPCGESKPVAILCKAGIVKSNLNDESNRALKREPVNKTGAKIFGLIILFFGIASCAIGFWLLSSRAHYEAAVKIKIKTETVRDGSSSTTYDPYFIQTEFEVIQSQPVLGKVIQMLHLNETTDHLRRQIKIRSVPNTYFTYFIEIRVQRENAEEAVRIANAIAESFLDFRLEQKRQETLRGIKILENDSQFEETNIAALREKVDQLRTELKVPQPEPPGDLLKSNFPSYVQAIRELKNNEELHQLLKNRLAAEKIGMNYPNSSEIEIVEPAAPIASPNSRNRWLGIFLFLCGLVMSVSGFRLVSNKRAT